MGIAGTPDVIASITLTAENVYVVHIKGGGGAAGTRTPYLFNAIEALSQMSYSPTCGNGNWCSAVRLIDCRGTA